jgi:hypothetical protein
MRPTSTLIRASASPTARAPPKPAFLVPRRWAMSLAGDGHGDEIDRVAVQAFELSVGRVGLDTHRRPPGDPVAAPSRPCGPAITT